MMMMDDDEEDGHDLHNQHRHGINNGSNETHGRDMHNHQEQTNESSAGGHGMNGRHEHHTNHRQNPQQHNDMKHIRHVEIDAYAPSQHQQVQQPSNSNHFHNNGHNDFAPINPIQHATPTNPPPPTTYHNTPPPSITTSPLVVLDAANIAYNYAESLNPAQGNQRRQPDPRGIRLAINFFLKHHCRVQAVVPISWYQLKPHPADTYHLKNRSRGDSDAKMVTEEVEELRNLRQQGFLVACPPGDDDDAYALALARREEDRLSEQRGMQHQDESMGMMEDDAASQQQQLPPSVLAGFIVSNDFFQDAIRRDERKQKQHSNHHNPLHMRATSMKSWLRKNRVSYSFANVGASLDGEMQLVFLPNPSE